MKKILWLCNIAFTENALTHTGGWLQPLAEALQRTGKVKIYNVTFGNMPETVCNDCAGIKQWLIPHRVTHHGQVATKKVCKELSRIESIVQPDLIHIWGTESAWLSIHRQGYLKAPVLLDIQGLLYVITDYYYGGITFTEMFRCIGLKEVLMPWRTLWYKKRVFRQRGVIEKKDIESLTDISCQSEWVRQQLSVIHPNARFHATKIMLREAFYKAEPWHYKADRNTPVIFSSCSAAVSYKGLHVLLKAVGLLKNKYPSIQLKLAGSVDVGNRLLDGYSLFIRKLIKKLGLKDNVTYLGPLEAEKIISHLQECNVCVVPSFIESYCLVLAEAMFIGVPTVVSFAGAMPYLAEHNKSALFYNSLDHHLCASYMDMLIQDRAQAEFISVKARENRLIENDPTTVVATQLNIYSSILNRL